MRLVRNWRRVLRHAWSVRLIALSVALSGAEAALPLFLDNPPLPRGAMAAIAFAVTGLAMLARLIAQKEFET